MTADQTSRLYALARLPGNGEDASFVLTGLICAAVLFGTDFLVGPATIAASGIAEEDGSPPVLILCLSRCRPTRILTVLMSSG
jgi:hypothetical protein